MSTLDPQALALGFFAVAGLGLLLMYAGIHLRRVRTAQRIHDRWVTWNRVHAAHLDAQLADVPPEYEGPFLISPARGEVHVCNVDGNCARGRAAR
jgi:hypothetical protein